MAVVGGPALCGLEEELEGGDGEERVDHAWVRGRGRGRVRVGLGLGLGVGREAVEPGSRFVGTRLAAEHATRPR
jgi:hypothetical protein